MELHYDSKSTEYCHRYYGVTHTHARTHMHIELKTIKENGIKHK